jgi:hypothetical protein
VGAAAPQGTATGSGREAEKVFEVAPWDRVRDRRTLAVLVLVVWAIYLATATYSAVQMNDNRAVNISAWSLGTRGTLALPAHFEDGNRWIVEGVNGELYTNRFPAPIVWAAPFHAVAELFVQRGEPDHPIFLNHAHGGVAAATVTALAVGASFVLFRRLADRRLAISATVVLAFGTGVWSVSADSMWTHGLSHLTLVLALLAAADGRNVHSGVAYAVSVLTRPPAALIAAVTGIWSSWHARSIRPALTIGLVSGAGALLLVVYSYSLFGTWQPIAGYREDAITSIVVAPWTSFAERTLFAMAHPTRGAFIYTPFLLILVPFVRHGWKVSPWWVRASAVGGLLYLVVQLRFSWAGGAHYFGSRMTLETLVLVAPLMLRTWQAHVRLDVRLRTAAMALMMVAVLIHSAGATFRSLAPEARASFRTNLEALCEERPELESCAEITAPKD